MKSKSAHTDMVQAGVLAPFVRVLEEGGGSVDSVFRSCPLPPPAIADPEVWLPKGQVHWLAERAAQHSGEATLGLRAGSSITLGELGGLGAALAAHGGTVQRVRVTGPSALRELQRGARQARRAACALRADPAEAV